MSELEAQPPLALFGKLPCQGDFLRVNMLGPEAADFEAWLTHAVEQSRGKLPPHPMKFLLSFRTAQRLVGAWIPSVDAVGREFPLAVFRPLPEDVAAAPWSLLPAFYSAYLDELEQTLAALRATDANTLRSALTSIAMPHASLVPAAWREGQMALTAESVIDFAARHTPDASLDNVAYALATFEHARTQASDPVTLDMRAVNELDLFAWLEMARALRVQPLPPSLLWSSAEQRALLMLGTPTHLGIAFMLDREHPSQRRWPLWTSRENARQTARANLFPAVRQALDGGDSLAGLITALSSVAPA